MSGIEKIDELSGEYPNEPWNMYTWKRNSIQVQPKNRKYFKHKNAILTIDSKEQIFIYKSGGYAHVNKNNEGMFKSWVEDGIGNIRWQYTYTLYVPDVLGNVDGKYINWSLELGIVIRKLKRLVGGSKYLKIQNLT